MRLVGLTAGDDIGAGISGEMELFDQFRRGIKGIGLVVLIGHDDYITLGFQTADLPGDQIKVTIHRAWQPADGRCIGAALAIATDEGNLVAVVFHE